MEPLREGDPRRLGRYSLTGRIGAGSMGVVYLAQTPRGTPVAVKTLTPTTSLPDAAVRFRREVEASLRVASPFTARVLDADLGHDPPYVVSEYVAGETLAVRVGRAGPLVPEATVAFAAATVAGLARIHAAGVVHRDLSPNNVILGIEGPRIVDLGVAAVIDATQVTATGTALGTPGFMSPEQARGEDVGPPSDLFAWASLVCFAVSGRSPFGEGRADTVLYRVVHEPADVPELPEVLDSLVHACLAKAPSARPTAVNIAAQLTGSRVTDEQTRRVTALLSVHVLTTRPYGSGESPTVPVAIPVSRRRWRGPAVAASLVAATVVAGAVYAASRPDKAVDTAGSATTAKTGAPAATTTPHETTGTVDSTAHSPDEPTTDPSTATTSDPVETGLVVARSLPDLYTAVAPHPLAEQVSSSWVAFVHEELAAMSGREVTASVCGSTDVALEFSTAPPSEFVCIAYSGATPIAVFGAAVSADASEWWRWGEFDELVRTEERVLTCWQPSARWLPKVVDDSRGEVLHGPAKAAGADVQGLGSASIDYNTAMDAGLGPDRASRYAYGQLLAYCARP